MAHSCEVDSFTMSSVVSAKDLQVFPTYDVRVRVTREVTDMTMSGSVMNYRRSVFVTNEGEDVDMLLLEGTIPVRYKGNIYHLPINIWIPAGFPLEAPSAYCTPVAGMKIKSNHPYVEPSGKCCLPYLADWTVQSTLLDMVMEMQTLFRSNPPMFSCAGGAGSPAGVSKSHRRGSRSPPPASATYTATRKRTGSVGAQELLSRDEMIAIVTDRLSERMIEFARDCTDTMDDMFALEAKLKESQESKISTFNALERKKSEMIRLEESVNGMVKNIDSAIAAEKGKQEEGEDIDHLIGLKDSRSKQLLQQVCEAKR